MRAPNIGLTVPRRESSAFKDYRQRIVDAGGLPIEITPDDNPAAVIEHLDGLMLPGGGDVDPARYDAEAHPKTDGVRPELDELEIALIHLARKRSLPVLAICRGHQVVNVALGGSLQQHIDGDGHRSQQTDQHPREWPSRWHSVQIEPASRLAKLLGSGELTVNSRHHQAVRLDTLAPALRAVALSPDGFVEGMEPNDGSWLVSVQWHPERDEVIASCRSLFDGFLDAVAERIAASPVLR